MANLPLPVGKVMKDALDERAVQRVWRGVQEKRFAKKAQVFTPAIRWQIAFASALVVLATFLSRGPFWTRSRAPGPIELTDGAQPSVLQADAIAVTHDFSDGSRITLGEATELRTLENSGRTFTTLLSKGHVDFAVKPGGPRRWVVECGIASVEVVGTRFAIDRGPNEARVSVTEGVVLVRSDRIAERVQRLTAGASLTIPSTGQRPAQAPPSPADTLAPSTIVEAQPRSAPASIGPTATSAPGLNGPAADSSWRDLAKQGEYKRAYEHLGADGITKESQAASIESLLALADVARLSGHPLQAVDPLSRITTQFAGDARAALAAFTLGRLELDNLGKPAPAAVMFAQAIRMGLPVSLLEDAYARLVEAQARSGNLAGASVSAVEYERRFPNGRHVDSVRTWVYAH